MVIDEWSHLKFTIHHSHSSLEIMPLYGVYVTCDQCGQPHSVHVQVTLDDANLNKARLRDVYARGEMPAAIAFMQTNKYRCPQHQAAFSCGRYRPRDADRGLTLWCSGMDRQGKQERLKRLPSLSR